MLTSFFQAFLGFFLCLMLVAATMFMLFLMDELVLKGYFATKLRKRFNVEEIK